MTTENMSSTADTAGSGTENAGSNVDTSVNQTSDTAANAVDGQIPAKAVSDGGHMAAGATPVVGADGKVTYTPNFKYKAALQEKELDPFFHSLIKDPDSEKKVKDLFTKVDAFDFIKSKKEAIESEHNTLLENYDSMESTVKNFNTHVAQGDLSSAFRLAGITKEQVFKWAQHQINLMEMPAEQRAEYERFEQTQVQKSDLEQKVSQLERQYQNQAVLARTMQLDSTLSRPEVSRFAQAWDQNSEPGAFRQFVVDEAKKIIYESKLAGAQIDPTPEQVVATVMQRFGKFLSVGETTMQSPQAIQGNGQRQAPPVIPNVTGKAASPIKKVPRSLDDLKKLAKEARASSE